MESFRRTQVTTMVRRLSEKPNKLIAVFGPRQTGKTTIALQALRQIDLESRYLAVDSPDLPETPYLDVYSSASSEIPIPSNRSDATMPFPLVRDTDWLVRKWREGRREANRFGRGFVLVFDEIQKIPNWSETVKGLWDGDRRSNCPLHVVILGSAPLLMQTGLRESLAGRFELIRVTHWSFREMSEAFNFDLDHYLYFGGYPGTVPYVRDPDRWRKYVLNALIEPSIERDLLSMTRVDKPALLKQLFELGCNYSGQILSYTKMLGQLQDVGNTTTLARYLDLLSSTGLLTGLPKYSNRPLQVKASSPKLNVLNTALLTAGSGYSFDQARTDRTFWGRLVESAVGAHLFNTAASDTRLHYWRSAEFEVDFVLQRSRRTIPVEVKSGLRRRPLKGMDEFRRQFHPFRSLLVGEGGIPLEEFLTVPAHQWFEKT